VEETDPLQSTHQTVILSKEHRQKTTFQNFTFSI